MIVKSISAFDFICDEKALPDVVFLVFIKNRLFVADFWASTVLMLFEVRDLNCGCC